MTTQKPGKKALRRDARVAAAVVAGRKTPGYRKHGMNGVN